MNSAMLELVYGVEGLYPQQLELHHPHILEKIVKLWHTPQMENFFLELMVNTRSDRQGFSHEVASELYYLSKVFDGTRNLPKVFDTNPLAHLNSKPVNSANFEHSPQDFINMRAPSDDSPWTHISPGKRTEISELGYPCTPDGFIKASAARDLKAIGLFLHCNINIDTCDERGWTPLFFSAFNGNAEIAKLFIEFGANVNMRDHGGFSPLHWAAFNGHADIIKHFITHNAEVNAHSLRGWTPLMMAAMNGHLAACTALIASGAETSLTTSQGWTALQKASFHHQVPVIKLLLSLLKDHVQFFKPSHDIDQPAQPGLV
jgi:hypothetical protein